MSDDLTQKMAALVFGRHFGANAGTVTDTKDPEGRHRVRAYIHALDIETDWAYPLTLGGGSTSRGLHLVPEKGGDVLVWFDQGDAVEGKAYYISGWWGDTSTEETPKAITDAAEASEQVQVLQAGLVQIVIDEREGQRSVRISDERDPPTSIELDLENRGVVVDGVSAVVIRSKGGIHFESPNITLNGRRIASGKAPI